MATLIQRKLILLISGLILINTSVFNLHSQTNAEQAFDFWLGSWHAKWNDSVRGCNDIIKTLDNKVIEEQFMFNDKSFVGKSWTVYDTSSKTWKQTWVDNSGDYLVFKGGSEGDKMILYLTEKKMRKGKRMAMRMVFFNISKTHFDWDWQSSEDDKIWKSVWLISYTRKT